VSRHTIWTELIAAGVDPADRDVQRTAMPFVLWKDLSTEQKHPTPEGENKWEGEDPGVNLARPVIQGLTGWPG
jgi:hypothetical protein